MKIQERFPRITLPKIPRVELFRNLQKEQLRKEAAEFRGKIQDLLGESEHAHFPLDRNQSSQFSDIVGSLSATIDVRRRGDNGYEMRIIDSGGCGYVFLLTGDQPSLDRVLIKKEGEPKEYRTQILKRRDLVEEQIYFLHRWNGHATVLLEIPNKSYGIFTATD